MLVFFEVDVGLVGNEGLLLSINLSLPLLVFEVEDGLEDGFAWGCFLVVEILFEVLEVVVAQVDSIFIFIFFAEITFVSVGFKLDVFDRLMLLLQSR